MATEAQIDQLYDRKTPTTQNKYLGIEIEFLISNAGFKKLENDLADNNLNKYVHLGDDGSVEYDANDTQYVPKFEMKKVFGVKDPIKVCVNEEDEPDGHEMRILVKQDEAEEVISKICKLLVKHGAYANHTCGLHVHLDMRNRDADKCFHNLFQVQDYMFNLQPLHRRTSEYCVKIGGTTNPVANHYDGINYQAAYREHRTIEVRIHEGTVDPTEINMWVKFLVHVVDVRGKIKQKVNAISHFRLPLAVRRYFNARIQRFA